MLYSNPITIQPDSTVLDPFMGIGSTAWVCLGAKSPCTKHSLDAPRNVIGFELKDSYHRAAVDNAAKAMEAVNTPEEPEPLGLFDLAEAS